MIVFRNVRKSFDNLHVLCGVNLQIEQGLVTAILGGSGSGKSVLLKHIIGLLKPDEGQILVEGEDVSRLPYQRLVQLRQNIGMVFQSAALFDSMNIAENLSLGLKRHKRLSKAEIEKEVRNALAMVGLKGVEMKYPAELSGGMKKRAAIARALVMKPRVLLYDEPTTGLDPPRADSINQLIIDLNKQIGITSIVVTHDMYSMYRIADKAAMLSKGVIRFMGTPAEMTASDDPEVREFLKSTRGGDWLEISKTEDTIYATTKE